MEEKNEKFKYYNQGETNAPDDQIVLILTGMRKIL